MASNLRNKIRSTDRLIIHDVNLKATTIFAKESGDNDGVEVAQDVKSVAEISVSANAFSSISRDLS